MIFSLFSRLVMPIICSDKDAQMCVYHISWQSSFGFCCELDEECARELTGNRTFPMALYIILLMIVIGPKLRKGIHLS